MTRSTLATLFTAAASALVLTACDSSIHVDTDGGRGDLKSLARLDCPEREDQLDRVSASSDGLTCTYAGEEAEVRLQLVSLEGRTPSDVLAPYERDLRALMPTLKPATAVAAMEPMNTDTGVAVGVEENDDEAHVRLPGMSIDTDGDRAQVRIGGAISIDADDTNSVVRIRSDDGDGDVTVNADETGAEIRTLGAVDGDVRSTFILASEDPAPAGWRFVGYEARGPRTGPVIVATIKSKSRHTDDAVDAMKDLVRKNIGE